MAILAFLHPSLTANSFAGGVLRLRKISSQEEEQWHMEGIDNLIVFTY